YSSSWIGSKQLIEDNLSRGVNPHQCYYMSLACILDTTPPAAITTLSALTGTNEGEISLTWIAPGDDGDTGGITGGKYRIRYSTFITDAADFWTTGTWTDFQNKYEIEWTTNTSPSASQARLLTGLRAGVTYYIRIWTADEIPNWSSISNAATAWAQLPPPPPSYHYLYIRYDFEGTTHNWSNAEDDGWGTWWSGITDQTHSSDYSYHGFNSLKCTANFNSSSYNAYVFIKRDNLPENYLFDYCPTKLYVYIPSGGPTDYRARIYIETSNANEYISGSWVTLQPGQWVEVSYTPTSSNVSYRRFGVHIEDQSPSTSWSGYIYIDAATWIQYDFENTVQGWVNGNWPTDQAITQVSSSNDYYFTGAYSLRGNCNFYNSESNRKGVVYIESQPRTPPANTPVSVRVLMPSGGPTGYTAKIFIQDNAWNWSDSGDVTLIPGSWTTIRWTPTSTSTPYQRVGVQVTWNGSTSYTGNIYFDSICWGDIIKPEAITTLSALTGPVEGQISLTWIAPGDDGWIGNIVGGRYRIRYSTFVTTAADFWTTGSWSDFQNKFEIEWSTNTSPYAYQRRRLTGLLPGVTYYIRIWTRDENPNNWSDISNAATSWAQWVIVGIDVKGYQELSWSTTYNFDWLQTNTSSIATYGLVIENTGNVYEDYGVRIDTPSMRNTYGTIWTIDDSSSVWYDRFVLEGVFYHLRPATTDYGTAYSETDDVITSTTTWASENIKYHPPASSNQPEDSKGIRVIPFDDTKPGINEDEETIDQRKFWFRIMTPLATSTTDIQTIPVEFKAKENPTIGPPP
ncbi:MAG: hypothetical protein ABDH23_04855, partial [Endomicrobiia bacterium]